MQSIRPQLTVELQEHVGDSDVWRARPFEIKTFRHLVEHVARLAYRNRNQLLFFRGQDKDYQSKAGGTTIYPAIYRGDNLPHAEIEVRFQKLTLAESALIRLFESNKIDGSRDIARKRYIQWSLLQHYEVAATPLLDVTQSLRVACSFAQLYSTSSTCFVYVLGFPYPTNRISINSEEDVVNIRLLSICPPAALRPYYQEGYMTGTPDITHRFDSKTELDVRNRLIAKFAIPRANKFWNEGFEAIPRSALYPSNDTVGELCKDLVFEVDSLQSTTNVGQLLVEWGRLEEWLVARARRETKRGVSIREALSTMVSNGDLSPSVASELEYIRKVRNTAAHTPTQVNQAEVDRALQILRPLLRKLDPNNRKV